MTGPAFCSTILSLCRTKGLRFLQPPLSPMGAASFLNCPLPWRAATIQRMRPVTCLRLKAGELRLSVKWAKPLHPLPLPGPPCPPAIPGWSFGGLPASSQPRGASALPCNPPSAAGSPLCSTVPICSKCCCTAASWSSEASKTELSTPSSNPSVNGVRCPS